MTRRLLPLALGALIASAGTARAVTTCPNIMFVIDQSSSMGEDAMGHDPPEMGMPSKFEMAREAVIQLVNTYGDRVAMGLELFRSDAFMSDAKCFSDTMIGVEPAHDQATEIIKQLKAATIEPGFHTNTGDAIKRAAQDPALADKARKNYIVLITDGVPSCNSRDLMTLSLTGTSDETIDQINAARNALPTIHTIVVGFDATAQAIDTANLSAMASSGGEAVKNCGGMTGTPCYYSANDAMTLVDKLSKFIDQFVGGEFGNMMCDDSCYSAGCPQGQVCVRTELDPVAKCVPDPCMGAQCGGGQFCRDGKCVNACLNGCKKGQKCENGTCIADPCWGVTCGTGEACSQQTGTCVPDLCAGRTCAMYNKCDPPTGRCVDDLCHIITCPKDTTCSDGNCAAPTLKATPGCTVATPNRSKDVVFALTMLGLLGVALLMRRRR
jgi:hypothetical protein